MALQFPEIRNYNVICKFLWTHSHVDTELNILRIQCIHEEYSAYLHRQYLSTKYFHGTEYAYSSFLGSVLENNIYEY